MVYTMQNMNDPEKKGQPLEPFDLFPDVANSTDSPQNNHENYGSDKGIDLMATIDADAVLSPPVPSRRRKRDADYEEDTMIFMLELRKAKRRQATVEKDLAACREKLKLVTHEGEQSSQIYLDMIDNLNKSSYSLEAEIKQLKTKKDNDANMKAHSHEAFLVDKIKKLEQELNKAHRLHKARITEHERREQELCQSLELHQFRLTRYSKWENGIEEDERRSRIMEGVISELNRANEDLKAKNKELNDELIKAHIRELNLKDKISES